MTVIFKTLQELVGRKKGQKKKSHNARNLTRCVAVLYAALCRYCTATSAPPAPESEHHVREHLQGGEGGEDRPVHHPLHLIDQRKEARATKTCLIAAWAALTYSLASLFLMALYEEYAG